MVLDPGIESQIRSYIKYQHDVGISDVEVCEVCNDDLCTHIFKVTAVTGQTYWVAQTDDAFIDFPCIEGQQPSEIARRVFLEKKQASQSIVDTNFHHPINRGPDSFNYTPPPLDDFPSASALVEPSEPRSQSASNVLDAESFSVGGHDVQYITCRLRPGQRVVCEPGAFLSRDSGINMDTELLTDGSEDGGGIMGRVMSPLKRTISGESPFLMVFINKDPHRTLKVRFAARLLGSVIKIVIEPGRSFLCQRGAYVCGSENVTVGPYVGSRQLPGHFFGDEGLILQRLRANGRNPGVALIHVGGSVIREEVKPGETFIVDTGCLALWDGEFTWHVDVMKGVNNFFFAKEGVFESRLVNKTSHTLVSYIQTMPWSRLINIIGSSHDHPEFKKLK